MASSSVETRGAKRNRVLSWKVKASVRVEDQPRRYIVDIGDEHEDRWRDQVTVELLTTAVLPHDPKWGDFITVRQASTYRNQGLYLFDGKKVVDLCHCVDDYGALPPNFQMGMPHPVTGKPIPFDYWWRNNRPVGERQWMHPYNTWGNQPYHGKPEDRPKPPVSSINPEWDLQDEWAFDRRMAHNYLVWFDHRPYRDELLRNLVQGEAMHPATGDKVKYIPSQTTWCHFQGEKLLFLSQTFNWPGDNSYQADDLKELFSQDGLIPFEWEYDLRFQKPRMLGWLHPSTYLAQMKRAEHVCKYGRCDACTEWSRMS